MPFSIITQNPVAENGSGFFVIQKPGAMRNTAH